MSTDKNGRKWAKLSELKEGDIVELDGGFTCHEAGKVKLHKENRLYFECGEDRHYIDGQADDSEHLIGIYGPVETSNQEEGK